MFRALRHSNFRLFFIGQLISLVGTWMQMLAQSWLVYRLTHSAAMLGKVGFVSQIPVLFLSTLAGIFADRQRRRNIIIATQTAMMVQALLMALLTLTGVIQVWMIFILSFFLGVCIAFDIPARQSFLVEMVGREDLMNAIALNSSLFNSARIIGPAVAGVLVAALGEGICFFLNGLSYFAVITGLLLMKIPRSGMVAGTGGKLDQLREGILYVRSNPAIRSLLLLLGTVSLLSMSYMVLMPVFADSILESGPRGLGMLMTGAGIGALLAALRLAQRRAVQGLDRLVARACAGFGVSLILFGLSRNLWLSMLLLVPAGYCIMVQLASTNTLIQSIVSDAMRGRVMGIYTMMFLGMVPFGSLIAGFMAQHFSATAAVVFCGLAAVTGASVFAVRRRHLKIDEQLAGLAR